jgi:hypothetical protein
MSYLYYYITYITPGAIIISIIYALLRFKLLTHPLKVLFYFLIFSGISNAANIILVDNHIHTVVFLQIYNPFEFAFISWFYDLVFNGKWRKIIALTVGVFTILCILNLLFVQNGVEVGTYTGTLEAVLIIGYSMLYLNEQSHIENNEAWENNALNWINIGFLIYYGCSLFMLISTNFLLHAGLRINNIVWSIYDTFLLIQYLLFAAGFYNAKHR